MNAIMGELRNLLDKVDPRDSLAWLDASDRTKSSEVNHAHIEGVGTPVGGQEEDWLLLFADTKHKSDSFGICRLLRKAGAVPTQCGVVDSFRSIHNEPFFMGKVEEYRVTSGRRYPPVYRVRLHALVEEVGGEEAAKYWRDFADPKDEAVEK